MKQFNHVLMNRYHYQTEATRFDTIDRIKLGIQGYIIGLYAQPDIETALTKLDTGWQLLAEYEADRDLTESLERIANTYKGG
ncbi:hypothetical protein [Streptococcus himalayensis]|uniref:Phage protein n=1 Tax=Streptococcus himalayensis TaxID=1888195 RepID=A0A917EFV5_9STRE|nr:hypothetical protein [Streptococcus himalayensis]QBX08393.1 hypothetical protein JavanS257_0003 [Streptococcus satellite phage Javan257]GGE34634.1 hypothetical protein GCM10011510_14960 [Streptococcus himalayensis]